MMVPEGVPDAIVQKLNKDLRAVVDEVLRRWDKGEKSLVFCFRVPTAATRRLGGRRTRNQAVGRAPRMRDQVKN